MATHLRITLSEPTLVYTFTITDDNGATVEWVRICVHPNEPGPFETMDLNTGKWATDVAM